MIVGEMSRLMDQAVAAECRAGNAERERDLLAAKLERVREIRDALATVTKGPQKKGHKERAWEYECVIANTKNDLDAILEGDSQ